MSKEVYFEKYDGRFWPSAEELKPFFFGPEGKEWFNDGGNDGASISIIGMYGTEAGEFGKDRVDLHLTLWGMPGLGVMIMYHKYGGGYRELYYSKGDMSKIKKYVRTLHDDPMPIGLFIPFAEAFKAVEDFINTEGERSTRIPWIAGKELPEKTFPDSPHAV